MHHTIQCANPNCFRLVGGATAGLELSITTATSCASRLGFQACTNSGFPGMKSRDARRDMNVALTFPKNLWL
jgi:hypothetical protein